MERVRLRSGREVAIRSIHEDDAEALEAFHERLSPQSRYQRFLAAKPQLSSAELHYLTAVDQLDHVALVATPAEDPEFIVAVGRFVRDREDPASAEFAIVVVDAFQGEGLATELLGRLADAALERGIVRFTATVLADNEPIHRLMRRLAGRFAERRRTGSIDELTIDLAA